MTAPRQVKKLYNTHKPSRKFETAFNRFYDDIKHERILDGLQGADLEEFLGFLDEVTVFFEL